MIVIGILAPFTRETYKVLAEFKANAPAGYQWPSLSDFWFTGVTAIVFWTLEQSF